MDGDIFKWGRERTSPLSSASFTSRTWELGARRGLGHPDRSRRALQSFWGVHSSFGHPPLRRGSALAFRTSPTPPPTCPDAHRLLHQLQPQLCPRLPRWPQGRTSGIGQTPSAWFGSPLKAEPEIRMWGSRWFVSEVVPGRPSEGGVPWGRREEPQPEPSFPGDPRGGGRRAHAPLAPLPKAVQAGAGVFIADPDFAGGEGVPNGGASRQPCSHSEPEKPRLGRGAEREGPRRCVGGGGRPPMVPPPSGRARSGLCPLPRPTSGCRHPPHTSSLFQNLLCQL